MTHVNAKASSLPMLIAAGILLTFLVGIAVITSILAKQAGEKLKAAQVIPPQAISPTPKEHSIYLNLPKDFPHDVPLLQSFVVASSSEDTHQWAASFSTSTQASELTDFYTKELPKAGWKITSRSQAGGITIIYAKKDQRSAIIAIGRGENGMAVSVTILKNAS